MEFDRFAHNYGELLDDPLRHRFAADADFFIHQKCRLLLRQIQRHAIGGRRPRLLDAGCGQGTAIAYLNPHAAVFGTDVSMPMLEEAAGRPVALQEPFSLPFARGTFHAAYAFCVYHHIETENRLRHLRELSRVVGPGGRVLIFEHNPYNPVTKRIFERTPVDQGWHMIKPGDLRALFLEAGLEDVEQGYFLFVPAALWKWFGFIERLLTWLPLGGQYFVSGRVPATESTK